MGKTCKYCGNVLNDGDNFCQKCGAVAESEPERVVEQTTVNTQNNNYTNNNTQGAYTAPAKTNGLCVASMIVSLVALCLCGNIFMAVIGICLGAAGLNHLKQFPNEKGAGMGKAGVIIGIVDIVIWISVVGLYFIGVIASI